jgi:Homeodomain-like domain/ParB-like nuclease domain
MDQPYQVLPPLSAEEYAGLKSDIAARGVLVPVEYDENGHILDGVHRVQICQELGITEWSRATCMDLTEEEKRAHAWRLNLARRHLRRSQKRAIAGTLRQEGWAQKRIAQTLSIGQATVSRWIQQFIQMDKRPQLGTIQGKDGKHYPSTKAGHRSKPQPAAAGTPASVDTQSTPSHQPEAQHTGGEGPVEPEATERSGDAPAAKGDAQPEATENPELRQKPSPA